METDLNRFIELALDESFTEYELYLSSVNDSLNQVPDDVNKNKQKLDTLTKAQFRASIYKESE